MLTNSLPVGPSYLPPNALSESETPEADRSAVIIIYLRVRRINPHAGDGGGGWS